ncbi:cyclodeaminase/cyclohydrolase family protein [Vreelandella sp. EE22]
MVDEVKDNALWQTPLATFRDALAHEPMPGCGAAASVVADFGLALMLKGLHLGQQHTPSSKRAALIDQAEALKRLLAPLADEDVAAFETMMAALQKPQATEREKDARREALHQAAGRAVDVPLETARLCRQALALGLEITPELEPQFRSDATAGAHLLTAALQSVLLNVEANCEALGSDEEKHRALEEKETLEQEAQALLDRF